ncbi:MAG: hypothetical protein SOU50_00755 [Oscillospiraceae bacterium]|nr:hypothetical protein [Oscillospiraceae bacterium]MDY2846734.1 hypothetical protein [Oscillospiraceae bacterium]
MANILNITTPVTPKDYQMPKYNQGQQTGASGEVFNLGDQTKVIKTNNRSEEYAEQDLKDLELATPSSAGGTGGVSDTLDAVKELLGKAAFAALAEKGDTAALNKLTEFAEEVILSPDELVSDLNNQQQNATIFSGKMWDALRLLAKGSNSEDMFSAVLDFAKAAANNAQKNEILSSLSANFKFLSEELAPSKAVSEELMKASEALASPDAARNYQALKSTLVQLINYTGESLLLDNKTQNLLPLIIHNMSRYSDDPSALRQSFDTLLNIFDNINFGENTLSALASASGAENADPSSIRSALEKLFDNFILKSDLPADVKASSVIDSSAVAEQNRLDNTANLLAMGIKNMAARLDTVRLKNTLSGIDPENGSASIKLALASVTPNTPAMADALDTIIANYDKTGDLAGLIDRLGTILNGIEDVDKKIPLAQVLNQALSKLAQEAGSNYSPPTSMDTLADFLVKNINDTALQSLVSMNQNDIARTMLTNPGVFNPLMHFFVPLDAYGMRAFAELWVDKNADRQEVPLTGEGGDEDTNHIFMCFDMENVGYFEMEMFAKGSNLSVMLLCPEGTEQTFEPLKQAVPRIAAASGYTVGTTIIDTLYRKRDLNAVFPSLRKNRGSFDAKA